MKICSVCEAENDFFAKKCSSCGAILNSDVKLSAKDYKTLQNFVKTINDLLDKSPELDLKRAVTMFILTLTSAFVSYVIYDILALKFLAIIASVLIFGIAFLFMSYIFYRFKTADAEKRFQSRLKKNIDDYLVEMNFKKEDFIEIVKKEFPYTKIYNFIDRI